jgi:hypothetical protein
LGIHETYLYGLGNPNEQCGSRGGPPEFIKFSDGLLELSCRNFDTYFFFQNLTWLSFIFVTFVIVMGLLLSVVGIIRKSHSNWHFVSIPCLLLLIAYTLGGAGISRYSFPTYPSLLILLTLLTHKLLDRKIKR